jgi:hypothetical protein
MGGQTGKEMKMLELLIVGKELKVVINKSPDGGFSLSDAAYELLISRGIPVRNFDYSRRADPDDEEAVIFDRQLEIPLSDESEEAARDAFHADPSGRDSGRYWDRWSRQRRAHPLLVSVVETLGNKASGLDAELHVIRIPCGIEWRVCGDRYGIEWICEAHRTWG